MLTGGCLDENAVVAFLAGRTPPAQRPVVEGHLQTCNACADLVIWVAADLAHQSRAPGEEGRPFIGPLAAGARVGRYQILGTVGRGGMGEVYAAYHPDLDRRVALKVVHELSADSADRRARLLREARAIARLAHPNVVTVHDAGTWEDRVFIAMELIDGCTIDQWLLAAPRTWQQIVGVFIGAGRGLAAAHAAGVVHRDFKPQNVMIAKNGSVRVMDFGLARVAEEDVGDARDAGDAEPAVPIGTITNTGAFIGTPAYMSPEQFRREVTDARSDQFSFCVALHEALFGKRPASASSEAPENIQASRPSPRTSVPGWLRSVVLRGASANREQRYRSMEELVAALERGRTRLRKRISMFAVGVAALVLSAGTWGVARGNRFACVVPKERVATAWSADSTDPRRQSIHRAFIASGRAKVETSWERVSRVLDGYVTAWGAMYVQTCEATHVTREQSAEVLDLRISCLNDNLVRLQALTEAFMTADAAVVTHAVTAATNLPPMSRCADVSLLKSAVPLPRDERTLRDVQRLRRDLAEIDAAIDMGRFQVALRKATAIRPEVERTGYAPLRGALLQKLGHAQSCLHVGDSEKTLEDAVFAAESAHDDATAAMAATQLVNVVGIDGGRLTDAERWFRLANSILDRLPRDSARTRSWGLNNLGGLFVVNGRLQEARSLLEQSVALKEESLGRNHPDVAASLDNLAWALVQLGEPSEALARLNRGISILTTYGDPSNPYLASSHATRGEALLALGEYAEAQASFEHAIELLQNESDTASVIFAESVSGLGQVELARGRPKTASAQLERARVVYEKYPGAGMAAADAQFALACSLWDGAGDRRRARRLAETARDTYKTHNRGDRAAIVAKWISSHRLAR